MKCPLELANEVSGLTRRRDRVLNEPEVGANGTDSGPSSGAGDEGTEVIFWAISGQIKWFEAAEILGMSDRSMRRCGGCGWSTTGTTGYSIGGPEGRARSGSPWRRPEEILRLCIEPLDGAPGRASKVMKNLKCPFIGFRLPHFKENGRWPIRRKQLLPGAEVQILWCSTCPKADEATASPSDS